MESPFKTSFFVQLLLITFIIKFAQEIDLNTNIDNHRFVLTNVPTRAIVVAHWKEKLDWIAENFTTGWKVYIYTKVESLFYVNSFISAKNLSSKVEVFITENWGTEALPYLIFITSHFHKFPMHTAFVHGDPFKHDLLFPYQLTCFNANFSGFFPLNGLLVYRDVRFNGMHDTIDMDIYSTNLHDRFFSRFNAEWRKAGVDYRLSRLSDISFFASAQFVVSAALVKTRTLEFWNALKLVVKTETEGLEEPRYRQAGSALEHIWYELFTGIRYAHWKSVDDLCGHGESPLLKECCETPENDFLWKVLNSRVIVSNIQRTEGYLPDIYISHELDTSH